MFRADNKVCIYKMNRFWERFPHNKVAQEKKEELRWRACRYPCICEVASLSWDTFSHDLLLDPRLWKQGQLDMTVE